MNYNKSEAKQILAKIVGSEHVLCDEPMKKHISFRVGGPADFMVCPSTTKELLELITECRQGAIPFYVMGNGSNLLVRDGGYRGVMINVRGMDRIDISGDVVTAEPGALLKTVAFQALEQDLGGMEFASGIPGTIGGAVVMNAGAYGGEMKDIVKSVEVINGAGELVVLKGEACNFGYRSSIIQENTWYITKVNLQLSKDDYNKIKETMDDLNKRRRDKQPLEFPSAGSTFRRPEGYFAGKLVQDCGFKGYSIGGAQVSEKHSGFVINKGDATAEDIITLIRTIQAKVKQEYDVDMKTEVIMIGE